MSDVGEFDHDDADDDGEDRWGVHEARRLRMEALEITVRFVDYIETDADKVVAFAKKIETYLKGEA